MAEEGEPLLIDDPDDERLQKRNARQSEDSSLHAGAQRAVGALDSG